MCGSAAGGRKWFLLRAQVSAMLSPPVAATEAIAWDSAAYHDEPARTAADAPFNRRTGDPHLL
jgi:hypothetical protein